MRPGRPTRRLRRCASAALAGLLALAGPVWADAAEETRRLLERVRSARDLEEREAALRALTALGEEARPALLAAAADPDPDLRFHVLYLLQAADVRTERLLRTIAEGEAADSGTHAAALDARAELLAELGPATGSQLLRILRRHPGSTDQAARYTCVVLDLLAEVVERQVQAGSCPPGLATELCQALELDLPQGFVELTMALDALPREQALAALRGVLAGGTPRAKARAARVLGELGRAGEAPSLVPLLQPLLRDADVLVRRSALHALHALPLPPDALLPAVPLAQDPDPEVAAEALLILADRELPVVREPAEALIAGRGPAPLRLHAAAALGLLGHPGTGNLLRGLATPGGERELTVLAGWALGAVRAPGAAGRLAELIATDLWAQEDGLYFGLARCGGDADLARLLGGRGPMDGARRGRALLALGRCRGDAAPRAVAALMTFVGSQPPPSVNELEQVALALADLELFDAAGCPPARAALAKLFVQASDQGQIDELLDILARVGGSDDAALQERLVGRLKEMLGGRAGSGLRGNRRELAADALAKVDPAAARTVLTKALQDGVAGGTDPARRLVRSMARSLARAGDPSFVIERALVQSRAELEAAKNPDERAFCMNNVGIDLLYARRYEEALVSFRQMLWTNPTDQVAAYNMACGHALAGRPEASLRYLRRAVRSGYDDPRHMISDTDLDILHADPRFQRLFRAFLLTSETGLGTIQDRWPAPRPK